MARLHAVQHDFRDLLRRTYSSYHSLLRLCLDLHESLSRGYHRSQLALLLPEPGSSRSVGSGKILCWTIHIRDSFYRDNGSLYVAALFSAFPFTEFSVLF